MSARWHLLTGEYPPTIGGISRFTAALGESLADCGQDVHVWVPGEAVSRAGVRAHALGDRFGAESRRQLRSALRAEDTVILQYTPNALGRRGANVRFCAWLAAASRRCPDVRIMFHEPFFYFGRQSPARNGLAAVQRLMAALLLSRARVAYLSSDSWLPMLKPYALGRAIEWQTLPVSVGRVPIPSSRAVALVGSVHRADGGGSLIGHFGTYARELTPFLAGAIDAVLREVPDSQVLCMGRGSTDFVAESFARTSRVSATGAIPEDALGAHLRACDLLIAPFGEGVTTRRTSVIGALALGCPVVTTDGRLTEPQWRTDAAVALAPAGDAGALAAACQRLLSDDRERNNLSARALATYARRFSPEALSAVLGLTASLNPIAEAVR